MQLKIISSSSAGNCYIFAGHTETLIIECGVKIQEIKKALNYDLTNVKGVIVSHEHKDHCRAVKDVMQAGIDVYASAGTIGAMNINHHRLHKITDSKQFRLGGFKIMPFNAVHDCVEPLNFLIDHEECGRTVFITDSYYCECIFPGLNNILVETNYSQRILDAKVRAGISNEFLRDRVIKSHMSLDTCLEFLAANDLKSVNNIILIHLSDNNSNAEEFKAAVQQATLKNVIIAQSNMVMNFDKHPF